MSQPRAVITHGADLPFIIEGGLNIRRSLKGLDTGDITFCCATENTFRPGGVCPGYPGLRIHEVDARYRAGDWFLRCTVSGLKSGSSRIISRRWRKTMEGWDQCVVGVVCLQSTSLGMGGSLSGSSSMYLVEYGEDEQLDDRWKIQERVYQGIATTKLRQRTISCNEQIVSPSEPIVVSLPGGWGAPAKGQVSLPKIVVTDVLTTNDAPDTNAIPGNATPPNPPAIKVLSITGIDLTNHWPNQWKLGAINSQELYAGAGIYIITMTYEYVWPATW